MEGKKESFWDKAKDELEKKAKERADIPKVPETMIETDPIGDDGRSNIKFCSECGSQLYEAHV